MHEISLVQGMLQQLHDIAREHQKQKVTKITMLIGPLSGIVVESFRFGFDILSKEDELVRQAELVVVIPPVTYRCSACGREEQTDGKRPECCTACQEQLLIAKDGSDLILQQVELE